MAKQKNVTQKQEATHTMMEIAGEKAAAIKEGIIEGKDKLVAAAGEKLVALKKAIHDFTASAPKPKKAVKAAKKAVKKAVKKAPKKTVRKAAKKVVRKK